MILKTKINKLYERHRCLKILTSAQLSSLRVNNVSDIFTDFYQALN